MRADLVPDRAVVQSNWVTEYRKRESDRVSGWWCAGSDCYERQTALSMLHIHTFCDGAAWQRCCSEIGLLFLHCLFCYRIWSLAQEYFNTMSYSVTQFVRTFVYLYTCCFIHVCTLWIWRNYSKIWLSGFVYITPAPLLHHFNIIVFDKFHYYRFIKLGIKYSSLIYYLSKNVARLLIRNPITR